MRGDGGTTRAPPCDMRKHRLPFMAFAGMALVAGVATGLRRAGVDVSALGHAGPADHGPLMVVGFLGTLIGLERAVALGRPWVYAGPLLTGTGALARLVGAPPSVGAALAVAGSAILVAALATVLLRQRALFLATMTVAALCWLAGNLRWLADGASMHAVSWWVAFLVLTIAAERLELTRLLPVARGSRATFVAIVLAFVAAVGAGGFGSAFGARPSGVALVLLAAWLVRHDLARRTIRHDGLPRFTAACLLTGYAWLAAAGVLLVVSGPVVAGPWYDAVVHAIVLGFVFAMIFGHAPIVFPAVLGVAIPYRARFYAHLVALHASLLVRIAGDVAGAASVRQWGAALNAAALALFAASTVAAVVEARHGDG